MSAETTLAFWQSRNAYWLSQGLDSERAAKFAGFDVQSEPSAGRIARLREECEAQESAAESARQREANRPHRPAPAPHSGRYDVAVFDGHVAELGDADDEVSDSDRELGELEAVTEIRESTYVRHCRNRAGETVTEEAFQKSYEAREELTEATLDLAFKLQSAGRRAFADPRNPIAFLVCPLSGRFRALPNVLGRKIFPTVAAAKRAKLVAALEFLLSAPAHKHDQFWTFTWGRRCVVGDLRATFKAMHRKLSKLNGEAFMRRAGARFIWRTSEIGGLVDDAGNERRDASGAITYHPHSHVLLHLDHFLANGKMGKLTAQIREYWGEAWAGLAGGIDKVRECCKYVAKPADLKRLSGSELVALDDALFRLHLVQPLGVLREQIRARRERCLTVKKEWRMVPDGKGRRREKIPVVLHDWNARKKDRFADKSADSAHRRDRKEKRAEVVEMVRAKMDGRPLDGEAWRQLKLGEKPITAEPPPPPNRLRPVIANRVVARLSPAPYFGRIATPALLVWNFDRQADTVAQLAALPFVAPALAACAAQLRDARARLDAPGGGRPAWVSVHTSPVTVRAEQPRLPELCRPDAWPVPKPAELALAER